MKEIASVAESLPRCGPVKDGEGTVTFRVWAPKAERVELLLTGDGPDVERVPMSKEERGYFSVTRSGIRAGQQYLFSMDGGPARPDPASRSQPGGVLGPSAVVDPDDFQWSDARWEGVPRDRLVVYELHVGTFTPEGTFDAAIGRLPELRSLGVTALEIMPVAQFPGGRNWGYDGVYLFAPQNTYGGPTGLKRLIDACHAHGLAVIVDVVYNHFGPEGTFLREFGHYFTDHYKTPWGDAVNYDGPGSDPVRKFVLDNARMWLEEYHADGLRLDAVHAIYDSGARHILRDIARLAEGVSARSGRPVHVIAESDLNDPRILFAPEQGGYGLSAQWSDDFHHAVHSLLTGERQGYYADFGEPEHVRHALEDPFVYAGTYRPHRDRAHGAPAEGLSGDRFVVCIQNHDQVGNRARGDRLGTLLPPEKQRLGASLLLLSPHLPMLFMGEEYGETNPFPFFCSFESPELVESVRQGRKKEFSAFAWQGEVPDPQAEETFRSAVLSWQWDEPQRRGLRQLYQDLLAARTEWPALRTFTSRSARLAGDKKAVIEFRRDEMVAYVNLTGGELPLPPSEEAERVLLFRSEAPRYGGRAGAGLSPFECAVFGPSGWWRLSE